MFQVTYGVVKEPIPIGPGPWGGEGGKPWDDGVYTGVKQIYITRNEFIGSIQIEYDRSGQSIWSTRHGDGGQITHRVSKAEQSRAKLNISLVKSTSSFTNYPSLIQLKL
jgi:hypothetical protein